MVHTLLPSCTSSREVIFCSLSFEQGSSLGSVVRRCLQRAAFMQPPPNEVTAMSFEGGEKSPQNNKKTQTNQLPPNNKTALPGCATAEILKLQPADITVVFIFHLFKDHKSSVWHKVFTWSNSLCWLFTYTWHKKNPTNIYVLRWPLWQRNWKGRWCWSLMTYSFFLSFQCQCLNFSKSGYFSAI